ncbi:MAG TPA: archaeosortase/exosortase family protein [Desulfosalsimonadaceae bacterium]|nr:archaeosortase/exosortase family protein [Desulfosalsimonadaceae bacterium]
MKLQNRQTTLWLICFLILMGLFYRVHQHPGVQSVLLQDLARINSGLAAWGLSLLGLELQQAGTSLIGPSGTIEIARSCTGSFVFLVFAAAVIPFPASRRSRLLGILAAIAVLFAINLLRICVIVLVASRFPRSLQVLHVIVGQAIVIAGMLLYFLWWARKSESGVSFAFTRSRRLVLQTAGLFLLAYPE